MEKVLCSNVMGYAEFIEKIKKMSESVAGEDGSVQVTQSSKIMVVNMTDLLY